MAAESTLAKGEGYREMQMAWLRQNYPEVAKAAMHLHQGKIVDAYTDLWNQVRPFGKEEYYYQDGKGE